MFLSLLSGNQMGRVIKLEGNGLLGRDPAVEYPIDDPTVSRRHAELLQSGNGWRLRDLGSANGTEINGVRLIGDKALAEGDVISLGRVTLQFTAQLAGTMRGPGPAVERTQPPGVRPEAAASMLARILENLRADHKDAEDQASSALLALVEHLPGASRASLVDWRAGKILSRAPSDAEISRSTLFRALAALKATPSGVAVWSTEECAAMAQSLSLPASTSSTQPPRSRWAHPRRRSGDAHRSA